MSRSKSQPTNPLVRFSSFFFVRWRLTLILWLILSLAALAVYHNLIRREGFPPIQFPITVVSGDYFVDDATRVDNEIIKPLLDNFSEVSDIKQTFATAGDNFFNLVVVFDDQISPEQGRQRLAEVVDQEQFLPEAVRPDFQAIDPAGFLGEYDLLVSVYSTQPVESDQLEQVASYLAEQLEADPEFTNISPQWLQVSSLNPQTASQQTRQTSFSYLGHRHHQQDFKFYPAITIGLDRIADSQFDTVDFSEYAQSRLEQLDLSRFGRQFEVTISGDFAASIESQIDGLESNLASGLMAITIVSFLLITWRVALITAIFMVSVVLVTILVMYLVGLSLNVITLFALVLALGLFVDDATIVVEAIEATRHKLRQPLAVIKTAVGRVAAASFAGTMTTVLVFAPMLFTTGVLGEFIKIMPITVIIALVTSFVLSLSLIPFLSRWLILNSRYLNFDNPINKLEQSLAKLLADKIRALAQPKARDRARQFAAGMLILSLLMVMAAAWFGSQVSLNIFPPAKDGNQLTLEVDFPAAYDLDTAEQVGIEINQQLTTTIGAETLRVTYFEANQRNLIARVELVDYSQRTPTASALAERLQSALANNLPASVDAKVAQASPGPPTSEFPFKVQVFDEDGSRGRALAAEIEATLQQVAITRTNGSSFEIVDTKSPPPAIISRQDGRAAYVVQAAFSDDDTTGLLAATQALIEARFDQAYLEANGYQDAVLGFDFGSESDNADSFRSLALVFPIALVAMFILLALQLRSLLQPLLVFLAIPFTLLGVTAILYLSDNSFSFFTQLGMIGLVGIAVNNTILLTDYANRLRRAGATAIEAVAQATQQRFRPLLATSLTTMVALLPLALADPFWQALSLTIIFGLLSSTLLVILAFPYYWLIAEHLRQRFSRRQGLMILLEIMLITVAFFLLPLLLFVGAVVVLIGTFVYQKYAKL